MKRGLLMGAVFAIAAPAAGVAQMASAPSTSIFGMEIGKPVPFPKCEGYRTKVVCRDDPMVVAGRPWAEVFIKFPVDEVPEVMSSIIMSADTVDGNIVALDFETLGIRSQDRDLALLSQKFGKPTSIETENMQTLSGGEFTAMLAKWEFTDLTVQFNSFARGVKGGRVEVMSPIGRELKKAAEAKRDSKRVPL